MKVLYQLFKTKSFQLLGLSLVFVFSCQEINFDQDKLVHDTSFSLPNETKIFGDYVPDSYIILLQPAMLNLRQSDSYEGMQEHMRSISTDLLDLYNIRKENIKQVYGRLVQGFAVTLTPDELKKISEDPSVKKIIRDKYYYTSQRQNPPGRDKNPDPEPEPEPDPEPDPEPSPDKLSWGLDRIDQRTSRLNGSYNPPNNAEGVNVYIMDTGILTTHQEFEGRASLGYDAYEETLKQDCNGHGTHVAGTVAGAFYGVAKKANLISVKVLDIPHPDFPCNGAGTLAGVIGGLEWIASYAVFPAAVNMSLGGLKDDLLNEAVNNISDMGIPVIVAAGNSGEDACRFSPGSASGSFTVGALDYWGKKYNYSSVGPCVDIFAPGDWTPSAWVDSNTATRELSGTSMAAPHVAGVTAMILKQNPNLNSQEVYDFLFATSTKHAVDMSASINNHLLFSNLHSDGAGDIDPTWDPTLIELQIRTDRQGNKFRITYEWAGINYWRQVGIYVDGELIDVVDQRNLYQFWEENGNRLTTRVYKVCNESTGLCSNEVLINYK